MNRRRRWWPAVVAGGLILGIPGTAHADAAAPSEWRSEVVSIEPDTGAVTASIEGGDSFVQIEVEGGHEVVVTGYAGEPYLLIDGDGVVYENRRSPATYYNQSRDGIAELPAEADPSADPEWVAIGDGGTWSWHDHRGHYMGASPPPGVAPGDSLPETRIPLTVDGGPVEIVVVTTLVASPSMWPAVLGGLAGALLVAAAAAPRRSLPVGVLVVALGGIASAVGLAQYASLPAETGPRLIWWIPPVVATACGIGILGLRSKAPFVRLGLLLVAASQLFVWGWVRRLGLVRGVLPTSVPFWIDRAVTAAALVVGVGLLVLGVVDLIRLARQGSVARSMAAPSSL
jgi:hypothetical protein